MSTADHPHARSMSAMVIDALGLLAFAGLVGFMVFHIGSAVGQDGVIGLTIWWALAGWLAADFSSGLVHWLFDRYGSVQTPFIGSRWIAPFREHHVDPKAICRHGFLETNGNNALGTLLILVPTFIFLPAAGTAAGVGAAAFVASLSVFTVLTNQIHKWAHADEVPRAVGFLQRAGLILSPTSHDIHHVPPHRKYFCITSGWFNRILDATRFYSLVELSLRLVGLKPAVNDEELVAAAARRASEAVPPGVSHTGLPRPPA